MHNRLHHCVPLVEMVRIHTCNVQLRVRMKELCPKKCSNVRSFDPSQKFLANGRRNFRCSLSGSSFWILIQTFLGKLQNYVSEEFSYKIRPLPPYILQYHGRLRYPTPNHQNHTYYFYLLSQALLTSCYLAHLSTRYVGVLGVLVNPKTTSQEAFVGLSSEK